MVIIKGSIELKPLTTHQEQQQQQWKHEFYRLSV